MAPESGKKQHRIEPIGVIRSPFKAKAECPIQFSYSVSEGTVTVFDRYEKGLKDIEGFSHLFLLYLFDRAADTKMVRPTFLDDSPHGIFACRHPGRPNNIGISIVRLLGRKGNFLKIDGVDVLDHTPLLDIKPYIPRFDSIAAASEGWLAGKSLRPKPAGRE